MKRLYKCLLENPDPLGIYKDKENSPVRLNRGILFS